MCRDNFDGGNLVGMGDIALASRGCREARGAAGHLAAHGTAPPQRRFWPNVPAVLRWRSLA